MSDRQILWAAIEGLQLFHAEQKKLASESNKSASLNLNQFIAASLSSKLLSVYDRSQYENGDLVRNISSLRYAFEALIITRLLLSEPGYVFKLFLGIHQIQETQIQNSIKRIKQEIKFLNELGERESSYEIGADQTYADIMTTIDNLKNEKILIWSDGVETNGHKFHAYSLEKNILAIYEKKKIHFDKLHMKRAKEIIKNGIFNMIFDTKNQSSRVFKSANDVRSWKDKAIAVDLGDEYEFIYSYTSSLMHCTSYSMMTSCEIDHDENHLIDHLSEQFISHIHTNLEKLVNELSVFKFNESEDKWEKIVS